MRISNCKVYDLEESIVASGYPMRTDLQPRGMNNGDLNRIFNLTKASHDNGAHGQWLTGVRVNFDLTFSNKAWVEAERYRFLEFVSSQSTMHRICKFDVKNQYNKYVDPRIVKIMEEKVKAYNDMAENKPDQEAPEDVKKKYAEELKEKYLEVLYSNPSGFELTARLTTNYRCLLNIYNQRKDHRLPEWREFCSELEELPYFKALAEAYLN